MKGEYRENPRTQRLNEVFNESGRKSFNAFGISVGVNQRSTQNYLEGNRVPTAEFILKVINAYPQYNQEWLMEGRGEKYNKDYVEVRNNPSPQIVGNSNNGNNTIGDDSEIEEIKSLYKELIESLRDQIAILKRDNDLLHKLLDKQE